MKVWGKNSSKTSVNIMRGTCTGGARQKCQSFEAYIAEEAAHHDGALKAVQSDETGVHWNRKGLLVH